MSTMQSALISAAMPRPVAPKFWRHSAPFLNWVYNGWHREPKEAAMPKLLRARPAQDATEAHQVRKLAHSRHAPADWIQRAQMIVRSWDGLRTTAIAAEVDCH